jgi:hypothetical protein
MQQTGYICTLFVSGFKTSVTIPYYGEVGVETLN